MLFDIWIYLHFDRPMLLVLDPLQMKILLPRDRFFLIYIKSVVYNLRGFGSFNTGYQRGIDNFHIATRYSKKGHKLVRKLG